MKLIIEIDEQHFEILQCAVRNGMGDNSQKIIANGIPLDKIRAEIEGLTYYWCEVNPKSVIDDALQIIDKYREGEQE